MNAVDVMDQYRGYCPTKRKEMRLSTALFGFIVDCCVHNAYGVFNQLQLEKESNNYLTRDIEPMKFQEFKRQVCAGLVEEQISLRRQRKAGSLERSVPQTSCLRHTLWTTAFSEKGNRTMRVVCHLCSLFRKQDNIRTTFICRECNRGFHVDCFNAWHNTEMLKEDRPDLHEIVCEMKEKDDQKTTTRRPLPLVAT